MNIIQIITMTTLFIIIYVFSCGAQQLRIDELEQTNEIGCPITHDDMLRTCDNLDLVYEYETGLCVTMKEWELIHDSETERAMFN